MLSDIVLLILKCGKDILNLNKSGEQMQILSERYIKQLSAAVRRLRMYGVHILNLNESRVQMQILSER